jgi:hypothetical protein
MADLVIIDQIQGPPGSGINSNPSTIVFQPGGTQAGNVFVTASAVANAISAVDGAAIVWVDDQLEDAVIPAGVVWNFNGYGQIVGSSETFATLTILDGGQINNPSLFSNINLFTNSLTVPALTFTSFDNTPTIVFDFSDWTNYSTAAFAGIVVPAGQELGLVLRNGSSLMTQSTLPLIQLATGTPGGKLGLLSYNSQSSSIGVGSLAGDSTTDLEYAGDAGAFPMPAWTLFSGTFILAPVKIDKAVGVTYNDLLVSPQLDATDVQAAIDALKTRALPVTGTGFVHVTGGVVDAAAQNVNLATEVTGELAVTNIAPGTNTYVLTTVAGATVWAPEAAAGLDQLTQDVTAGPGSGSQAATVVGLQTNPVSSASPTTGNTLEWNGTAWAPAALNLAGGSGYVSGLLPVTNLAHGSNGQVLETVGGVSTWSTAPVTGINQLTGDVTAGPGTGSQVAVVTGLQTLPVSTMAPTTGNTLEWNGSTWIAASVNLAGGTSYVNGTLPAANQAYQTMGGDVSGTTHIAEVNSAHNGSILFSSDTIRFNGTPGLLQADITGLILAVDGLPFLTATAASTEVGIAAANNMSVGATNGSYGGGVGVLALAAPGTAPTTLPTGTVLASGSEGALNIYDAYLTGATSVGSQGISFPATTYSAKIAPATSAIGASLTIAGGTNTAGTGGNLSIEAGGGAGSLGSGLLLTSGNGTSTNGPVTVSSGIGTTYNGSGAVTGGPTPGVITILGPGLLTRAGGEDAVYLPVTVNGINFLLPLLSPT